MNLIETVNRARRGDQSAFTQLVDKQKADLYRIAFSYVKNQDDALDIVHETVYKAFVSIEKLKNPEHFSTWLTRILINCAINQLRKSKKVLLLTDQETVQARAEERDQTDLIDLYTAIDKLSNQHKTVILLKYFRGFKVVEIAEVLGCPVGTAKTYLHQALKELRLELKEEY
ncbi:sigma-70 family RNA polymerase sigma factor [Desulfolucanica intricata]|uniref:sigma-70 family RNA polymerase sigma factor n=1 Tax=Desulfolucanica intricata TaxID=1285191 RepID=UPI00082C1A73|nr:sigma-70 family RNA polymerase sigma factor [Desulfolucanica intricata]